MLNPNQPWSVVKLASENVLARVLFSRLTYSLIFLWVLTWFSYLIFMKNQLNSINILGASISASLIFLSNFLPRDAPSKGLKLSQSPTRKTPRLTDPSPISKNNKKIHTPAASVATTAQPSRLVQTAKSLEPKAIVETQKQEPESIKLADKSPQPPSKSNGCPKNLEYFTKKPRPKQTPEECIMCNNLLTCVCLTSN